MLASDYHQQVRRQFSRAAPNYLQHSAIQQVFGEQLLQLASRSFTQLGDIGCGPATMTAPLLRHCDVYHGLDLSSEMITQAKQRLPHAERHRVSWHTADAEQLPLADKQLDGYYANMSLQWCRDFQQALFEMKRVLRPAGVGLFSIPVEGTFDELNQSFAVVDDFPHTQRFASLASIKGALSEADFNTFEIHIREEIQWFSSVTDALRSIKGVGANYVERPNASGLLSPRRFARMVEHYERFRSDEGVPLRWKCALVKLVR